MKAEKVSVVTEIKVTMTASEAEVMRVFLKCLTKDLVEAVIEVNFDSSLRLTVDRTYYITNSLSDALNKAR